MLDSSLDVQEGYLVVWDTDACRYRPATSEFPAQVLTTDIIALILRYFYCVNGVVCLIVMPISVVEPVCVRSCHSTHLSLSPFVWV
jgi:hypothetical protein